MAKMNNKLIVMCSAAISAVYASGYIVTEPAPQAEPDASANSGSTHEQYDQKSDSDYNLKEMLSMEKSSAPKQQGKYKSGTYTGVGTNNIGSVQVAIKVGADKIESVKITKCTTSFPQSDIDPLSNQVISNQSVQVDNVSGATESTEDFKKAVEMAINKAKVQ